MMTRALALALVLFGAPAAAQVSPLWDDVVHPGRLRCRALVDQARPKLAVVAQREAALAALEEAARRCPRTFDGAGEALELLGEVWVAGGELGRARAALEQARRLADLAGADGDASLAFHLGLVRAAAGDLEGSLGEYRRALALGGLRGGDQWLLHYDLGDDYMALGRLDEAIECYRRAARAAANEPMVHLALAVALDRDGQLDEARAQLAIVLTIDPQLRQLKHERYIFIPPADEHYYRALAELGRGRLAEVRAALRAFLAALPDGPYRARARALAERADAVDARELTVTPGGDAPRIAAALTPLVAELERCLEPGAAPVSVRLHRAGSALTVDGAGAPARCLEAALARVRLPAQPADLWIAVPLAPRR
jgi:tetratricopeptide (TPR) repeat protein